MGMKTGETWNSAISAYVLIACYNRWFQYGGNNLDTNLGDR